MTPSADVHAPARPLRRDAAANRARILTAAAEVFHESGPAAGLDDVARRAGVGVGTVYRNFADREALLEELLADLLGEYAALAERSLDLPGGTGLAVFLTEVAEVQATARGVALRLWSSPTAEVRREQVRDRMQALLVSAQRAGTCRSDVTVDDLVAILVALRGVREAALTKTGLSWRRHLALCLAGLRGS